MGNNIWKIERAGLYSFGHINSCYLRVELSKPGAGWCFDLPSKRVRELIGVLDIDDEDGVYVHEVLKGKYVTAIGRDGMTYGVPVAQVGDPYGERLIDLTED